MKEKELAGWLSGQGVDISRWGQGGAKRLQDLVAEIAEGETILSKDPVCRDVMVVRVNVFQDGRSLIEGKQEMEDGQIRERNMPPSEKMKYGEDVQTAVYRCLLEELGLYPEQIDLQETDLRYEEVIDSPSYPGLLSCYQIFEITAVVTGLPTNNFWRDNDAHNLTDPVKRHFWVWQ